MRRGDIKSFAQWKAIRKTMAGYVTCCVAKGHEQRATMRFVTSLTVRRSQAADKSKNIKEWSLAEAEAELGRSKTLCEYLSCDGPWTKPYFDTESYHYASPSEEALEAIKERSLASVDKVMEDQEGYVRSAVRVGQRHGVDPKHDGRYKVSFRMWVLGFKVEYPQLGKLVEMKGVGGDGEAKLDLSVYKGPDQLMNCMGCCKGSVKVKNGTVMDERVLKAVVDEEPWSTYLVQHLRGDEIAMTCPQPVPASVKQKVVRKPRAIREAKAQEAAVSAVVQQLSEATISEEDDEVVKLLRLLKKGRWVVR